jgi:hypothetical protein
MLKVIYTELVLRSISQSLNDEPKDRRVFSPLFFISYLVTVMEKPLMHNESSGGYMPPDRE